ncbi:hypothetical protein RYX36_000045 [Vicia faba]
MALSSLIQSWKNKPLNWVGSDPCRSEWDGIRCANSRITELLVLGFFVSFKLFFLYFCKNMKMLNENILCTLGNLAILDWLDLNDNQLEGSIPVSDDQGQPGLDMLLMAQHLDLSDNNFNFSDIPSWVYASSMPDLTTVILKDNQLSGTLNLSSGYRRSRQLIDLQNNGITELELGNQKLNFDLSDIGCAYSVKMFDFCSLSFLELLAFFAFIDLSDTIHYAISKFVKFAPYDCVMGSDPTEFV